MGGRQYVFQKMFYTEYPIHILSAYYMWGFTPLSEAVVQARGQGGERQVEKHDHILVSGNGGVLNYHSTTILSKHPA